MRIVKPQMSTTINNNNNSSWKERLPEETDSRIDVGNYASAKIGHGAGLRGVAAFANLTVTTKTGYTPDARQEPGEIS